MMPFSAGLSRLNPGTCNIASGIDIRSAKTKKRKKKEEKGIRLGLG
jgi:hypothetical protein